MRGKIWTLTILFIASLMLSIASVKAPVPADYTVSLDKDSYSYGPGETFTVNIVAGYVEGVRAVEFTLRWNQKILKILGPDEPPALGAFLEGPFLAQAGAGTDPVARKGLAGDWVNFNNLIPIRAVVDGSGVIATIPFEVIGGGKTSLTLTGELVDIDFIPITVNPYTGDPVAWVGGTFWNPFPYIDFKWRIPTAVELPPQDVANVTGTDHYVVTDPDGDTDYKDGPPYWALRPVLTLNDATGAPEGVDEVEGGTMYYGDQIIFDASKSYDLDSNGNVVPLDPTKFHWTIQAGGVDKWTRGKVTADFRYESGDELPTGPTFSYWFPGPLAKMANTYAWYGATHLGFHLLTLQVTDSDGNVATFKTWIRIYRLCPAATVMAVVPDPKHSLKDGNTMLIGGKVQNKGGTGAPYWFIWDSLAAYLELARMVHPFMWVRMQYTITDVAGVPMGTVYSDAIWLGPTETPVNPMWATWTIPSNAKGTYYVEATAWFCGSGVTYALKAGGAELTDFEILP